MSQTCRDCCRVNPSEAAYCYYDGVQLNGRGDLPTDGSSISFSNWVFPNPFVFPSGEVCRNFPSSPAPAARTRRGPTTCCRPASSNRSSARWAASTWPWRHARRHATPTASAASTTSSPSCPAPPWSRPSSKSEPAEIDLGTVQVGEERRFDLVLRNGGDRLLFGKAAADDCPWLVLGDSGTAEKLFQFVDRTVIPVRIRPDRLRAYTKPQKGEIVLESNGGNVIVTVSVMVPIKPFPRGRAGRGGDAATIGGEGQGQPGRRPPPSSRAAPSPAGTR